MSKLSATKHATVLWGQTAQLTGLALLQLMAVAALGCRSTTDNQLDLLERELRTQENYIYELESYVVEYSEKLRDTRSQYPQQTAIYAEEMQAPEPTLRRSKKKAPRQADKEDPSLEPAGDLPLPAAGQQEPKNFPPEISPEEMEVPEEIDLQFDDPVSELEDTQTLQQIAAVDSDDESLAHAMLIIPDPVDFEPIRESDPQEDGQFAEQLFDDQRVEEEAAFVDRVADRLEVTQLFHDDGDELSPTSLLTVVEALDEKGEPVDLDGEVSLMIMTAEEETPRRLKRWNFTAEETVAAWQSSDLGDGLHLELPLEKGALPATPLELWVRLVTSDGRKLLTQLPFDSDQLSSIATESPKPVPAGLSLAEVAPPAGRESQPSATRQDPLKKPADSSSPSQAPPQMTENVASGNQAPNEFPNQFGWRASMQQTDRSATGFAASSAKTQRWTTQALGRQPYAAAQVASAQVASRTMLAPTAPSASRRPVASPASTQPRWTSGHTALPGPGIAAVAPTTQQPAMQQATMPQKRGGAPVSWSSSR